jgi:hypothetical protein
MPKDTFRVRWPRDDSKRPKVGDFVLYDDIVWIIQEIDNEAKVAHAETALDIGIDEPEEFYLPSLAPTSIKTWEIE